MARKVASALFLGSFLLVAAEGQSASCSDSCTDYHRLCPGVNNAGFYTKYLDDVKNKVVEHFREGITHIQPSCDHALYGYICPMTCGKCTPCFVTKINDALAKISALEGHVQSLSGSLTALEDKISKLESAKPAAPVITKIPINGACSSQEFNGQYVLANSHDGGLKTKIDYCFHSKASKNGWAEYEIPSSNVVKVGVLNRESVGSAKRLKGARVEVCSLRGGCSAICGIFPDVPASQWGYVECAGGGIEGSYVRIINDDNFLQICEVDIEGEMLNKAPLKMASILSATSSTPYYFKWSLANSHDGGVLTHIDYCFHTKAQSNGWAEYQIQASTVKYVGVLNRQSVGSAKRLKGSRVEVCQNSGGCSSICGTFPDVPASSWGYVECPGAGLQGNYIRVINPGNFLQICEMDIRVV